MITSIRQILSTNIFQALKNAVAPTAANPFATIADISAASTNLFTQTASVTVTAGPSTLVGAGVGTASIPANHFTATDRSVKIQGRGIITKTGTKALLIEVQLAGVNIIVADFTSGQIATPTNCNFLITVYISCRTTGAGGTIFTQGECTITDAGGGASLRTPGTTVFTNTATSAINTTIANTIDIRATWTGVGSGSLTLTNLLIYPE
jgi:hypothetical protein